MQHITYGQNTSYPVAILVKSFLVDSQPAKIQEHYVDPLVSKGVNLNDIIVIGLPYTDFKKVTAKKMNETIPELQKFMDTCGTQHVFVADTPYLKKLAKLSNVTNLAGVLLPSVFGSQRLFKGRVYTTYQFDDKASERVNMGLDALAESYRGSYTEKEILKDVRYPHTVSEIKAELDNLLQYDVLAVDIEGFGLRLDDAGIATISFSWDEHSAIAFGVDYRSDFQPARANWEIRTLLLEFLLEYADKGGSTIYHGIAYDVKHLVANLFMRNDLLDYPAMVDGVRTLTENAYCTKDLSYLATNSAAGNTLGLKHLTLEFTGRYAIDVTDVTKHKLATVLEYNAKDTCATFWLYKKMMDLVIQRDQHNLYFEHYKKNQRTLITIELTGMPLDMDEVIRLRRELDDREHTLLSNLRKTTEVKAWERTKSMRMHAKYQDSVKGDGRTFENFIQWKAEEIKFKPSQDRALVWVLHEYFGLDVIDKTAKAREPSVADDTLEKHLNWIRNTEDPNQDAIQFIENVREYLKIDKINGTFVKAFITKSIRKKDGVYYLHGGLNQGGTLSGRLSSNDPNLQNLPSGGYWGKAIKKCFKPPAGKVMLASDYAALEARIAAMRTKDPNMTKVFTDGFDSHSMNTYAYASGDEPWYSQITDPNDPASINQIKKLADSDRTASKPVTFALQFLGSERTLMNNQGYSQEKSQRLVEAYNNLYCVYFTRLREITDQAGKDGYVKVAYGLRIDAPAIHKSVTGSKVTPSTVAAEVRSISNAVCQSYGQMNTFAADDFMRRVWDSKWKYDIQIQALIHDAIYLFVPQNLECIKWVNDNLIECMTSQMEDNIKGSPVVLEAELDVHYPTWAQALTIKNEISVDDIKHEITKFILESANPDNK